MNAFVGLVSLCAGSDDTLWSVVGGNWRLCEGLLRGTKLHLQTRVVGVAHYGQRYMVKYQTNALDAEEKVLEADAVIIAAPLQNANLSFSGFSVPRPTLRMHHTHATFVKGHVAPSFFQLPRTASVPVLVLTTNHSDNIISSMGQLAGADQLPAFKIFSNHALTAADLAALFTEYDPTSLVHIDWEAYPHYAGSQTLPSFQLHDGIFYINAIESVASAMEMSALSAKNAALLAARYLQQQNQAWQGASEEAPAGDQPQPDLSSTLERSRE